MVGGSAFLLTSRSHLKQSLPLYQQKNIFYVSTKASTQNSLPLLSQILLHSGSEDSQLVPIGAKICNGKSQVGHCIPPSRGFSCLVRHLGCFFAHFQLSASSALSTFSNGQSVLPIFSLKLFCPSPKFSQRCLPYSWLS